MKLMKIASYGEFKRALTEELTFLRDLKLPVMPDYCFAPEWFAHKAIFLAIHPKTKELIVHDGVCAKVYANDELIYSYEHFDKFKPGGKRFAGDTHGAITITDSEVYFGGFAYSDVSLSDHNLIFVNKYTHIHRIREDGRTVDLVWHDGPGTETTYVGEVTDMQYSPKENAVLFTRGDGGADIWKLDLNTMQVERVTYTHLSILKMELYDDTIVTGGPDGYGSDGHIVRLNLRDYTVTTYTSAGNYITGTIEVLRKMSGQVIQYYNRFWAFGSGYAVEIEPKWNWIRMQFPFFRFSRPLMVVGRRSQKAYVAGVPILAVNPWDTNDEPRASAGFLLRWDVPVPQIVMQTGYVSGLATDGKYLYIAGSPQNALFRGNPVNYEPGRGNIIVMPVSDVFSKPKTPVIVTDEYADWAANDIRLGVPLAGFTKKVLKVKAPTAMTLRVYNYYNWPASAFVETSDVSLSAGWNTIDLSPYDGIVGIAPTTNITDITYMTLVLIP